MPSTITAYVDHGPAARERTPLSPTTATGADASLVVPSPSCPKSLLPQHETVPPERSAHVCPAPAVRAKAPTDRSP